MEIVNNLIAKIYERDRDQDTEANKFVTWYHVTTITQFPTLLMGANSANFLFSPNFDRYIDVVYSKKQFCVRKVVFEENKRTSSEDQDKYKPISKDIISMNGFGDTSPKEVVKYLASRMMFVNDDIIRILNEEGLDILLNAKNFKMLSYTKVDN